MKMSIRVSWMVLLALLIGCEAQVPGGYQGESLATIRGTVRNEASDPPEGAELVMRWHYEDEEDRDAPVYESIEVAGEFPAAFRLDIFEPPPERTFGRLDGPDDNPSRYRVAVAAVEIYPEGTTVYVRENAISWEERHFVQYAPEGVPGEEIERGVDIPQGFSLVELTPEGPVERPIDTRLEIRLVDDTGELHDPFDDV
jgi:hypothetical protein